MGPLQEAQEAELGAGTDIASPDHGARQLLPELLPYTHKNPSKRNPPSTIQFAMMRGQGSRLCVYGASTGFRQDSGFACNSFENIANRFGGVGNLVANGISSTCHLVTNGIGGAGHLVANCTGGIGNLVTNGIGGAGDLVTQITSGVNHLGLNLLGIPLGFEKGVIGELTGGRLQLAFDVLGGGVDLVVDAHGDAAEGEREAESFSLPRLAR
jgi:hypothetical protein